VAQPNPQELDLMLTIDAIDEYKRYDCRVYAKCLDVAADASWDQFHCNSCKAYVALPIDDPSRRLFARLGKLIANRIDEE
jgi:uncharacterized protein (DUF736 family)